MTFWFEPPAPPDPVTRTSTIVPGITNPATPTTSLTATVSARIPSGIVAGRPAPDCCDANLPSRTGSFSARFVIKARFAQSSMRVNMPATGSLAGQGIRRRFFSSSRVPRASGIAATTMCCVTAAGRTTLACFNTRYTNPLNRSPASTATANPMIRRFWFMKEVS